VRLKTRSTPVIIATAFGDTLAEALDAGADDLVNKPPFSSRRSVSG
jgi:CheY-like chemotaxis protein